jgi:hypothetical protein
VYDGYIRDIDGDGVDGGTARVLECYDLHIDHVTRGIVASGSLVVEACHVERCSSHGIEHSMSSSGTSVSFVDETECRACAGHGITVHGDLTVTGGLSCSVTDVDATDNGGDGVSLEFLGSQAGLPSSLVRASVHEVRAASNAGAGLRLVLVSGSMGDSSVVAQCEDLVCSGNALGVHVSHVTADLIDCVSSRNGGDGFLLVEMTGSVEACVATHNLGDGVHVTGSSSRVSVSESSSQSNGAAGIHLDSGVTLTGVQDNDVANDAVGVRVQSPGNLLVRNTALGNGTDYDVHPSNPVVIVPLSGLASSTNPHANYSS